MDQASSLREMMKKMKPVASPQKGNTISTAFISGEGVVGTSMLMKKIAQYTANHLEKQSAYFLSPVGDNNAVELYLDALCPLESVFASPSSDNSCKQILGSLDILSSVRQIPNKANRLRALVKELEKDRDLVMYGAGSSIGSLTINLAAMASKVVFVIKPTNKGVLELLSYLRVFSKVKNPLEFGIIMDTSNNDLFQKQWEYLQEINNRELNNKVEAIGCFDLNYIHLFDEVDVCKPFSMDFFIQQNAKKKLSDSIAQIF